MGKKVYQPEQIIAKLREAEIFLNKGQTMASVIGHLEITEHTCCCIYAKEQKMEGFPIRRHLFYGLWLQSRQGSYTMMHLLPLSRKCIFLNIPFRINSL